MIRIFLLCCLSGVLLADLPEYKPPFQAEPERRMPPELKVGTFLRDGRTCEQPGLMIGGKRIGLRRLYGQDRIDRDFIIGVQADGRDVFHIRFWGSLPGGNSGWPFRDLPGEGGQNCGGPRRGNDHVPQALSTFRRNDGAFLLHDPFRRGRLRGSDLGSGRFSGTDRPRKGLYAGSLAGVPFFHRLPDAENHDRRR